MGLPAEVQYWLLQRGKPVAAEIPASHLERRAWVRITPMIPSRIPGGPYLRLREPPDTETQTTIVFEVFQFEADRQEIEQYLHTKRNPDPTGSLPDVTIFGHPMRIATSEAELEHLLRDWLDDLTQLRPLWQMDYP